MCAVNFYEREILPRFTDVVLGSKRMAPYRARVNAGLEGEVLEVGFGSGTNVPFYPPSVTRMLAVDPAELGRTLAAKRLAQSPVPVEFIGIDGADLPLESESVDHVLTTFTLCTIPDIDRALAEMRRVLKPGGTVHFCEHGASPDPRVRRWQDRITPVQRRLFGGCHLNRRIDRLIDDAGFAIEHLDNSYQRGPKPLGYMYEGVARKPQPETA
jgi:ubiquinone/menaquinone biosynthesis C-methylase UbiE